MDKSILRKRNENDGQEKQIVGINQRRFRQKLAEYKRTPGSLILLILVYLSAILTIASIGFLLVYVLVKGIPNLTPELFKWEYNSENCSMLPALINTVFMTLLSLLVAAPIGIFAAIYLVEYAKKEIKL